MVGYGERRKSGVIVLFLPVVASVAFLLIADLDSPRGDTIRVHAQNLAALSRSINAP